MNIELIFNVYAKIFAKKELIKFNKFLFDLSLRGMGILNYQNSNISGEKWFLENYLLQEKNAGVIFDVGANIGNYSELILNLYPELTIYSFEPHPITFQNLKDKSASHSFIPLNIGMSDKAGIIQLYDYNDQVGSSHASIYKGVFEKIHKKNSTQFDVEVSTVDCFCNENNISKIALLKIDTEGHEYQILQGAKRMLTEQRIQMIHFEFNEMNIISRTFINDFMELLPSFSFYRMLPAGLANVDYLRPCHLEIYAYQNIVAIKN